jgi:hypothetical protein
VCRLPICLNPTAVGNRACRIPVWRPRGSLSTVARDDETPMNFCPKSAKARLIHPSAWNKNSRKVISKIPYSPAPIPRNAPPPCAPHSPAPVPLVIPMDRYARLRMLPCRRHLSAAAIISEGPSDPSHTLRVSGRGKAKGRGCQESLCAHSDIHSLVARRLCLVWGDRVNANLGCLPV